MSGTLTRGTGGQWPKLWRIRGKTSEGQNYTRKQNIDERVRGRERENS